MLNKPKLTKLLSENYALLAILIGVTLISISIGPFQTLDTQLEFETTKTTLANGYPFLPSTGEIINEPPLGFYTAALFFKVFSFSVESGTNLVMLFGLGCVIAVYKIGKELYGKTAGVFGAAFFALAPWEFFLSRAFLIDAQCLFLSLVCLYFGILAIRKESGKLALVSGILFAAALLTKLYAVFMLVPLLILYIYSRPKKPKLILTQLAAFTVPALYSTFLWYQLILKMDLLSYFFGHNDFRDINFSGVVASPLFVPNFLVNYGLGLLFLVATAFSLIIGLVFMKLFSKKLVVFDLVCFVTLLSILGVNIFLGVNLNLKAPYTSAIKFSYQALPFFSLLAGSLVSKSVLLFNWSKNTVKLKRVLIVSVSVVGVFLLVTPLLANLNTAHQLSMTSYIVFQVQPGQNIGYSFYVLSPTSPDSFLMAVQYLGFGFVLSGLVWVSRRFVFALFKQMHR
jgi:4-amino-4-deoxy-L-arabinose transferase-like glycosyltransferase